MSKSYKPVEMAPAKTKMPQSHKQKETPPIKQPKYKSVGRKR